MTLKPQIETLMQGRNLDAASCAAALNEMLIPDANPLQTAAFLVLLRAKPETAEELSGMMHALKQKMLPVSTPHTVLDIVGTGGDGAHTVNISTGSAILAASCGVKIVKHGNRAISSQAGSADVLEALGIKIDLSPEQVSASIDEIGIGFCFAPLFHPSIAALKSIRSQLAVPTTFNLLGPLSNPANPQHVIMGVYDKNLCGLMAEFLQKTGTKKSWVVHGCGIDEISCVGPIEFIEITENNIYESVLYPETLGLSRCSIADLKGGDAKTNAQLLLDVFSGKYADHPGLADTLILNAAVALYLYDAYETLSEAVAHAQENLYNRSAETLLKKWGEFSNA